MDMEFNMKPTKIEKNLKQTNHPPKMANSASGSQKINKSKRTKSMRKCGLILETGCKTFQEPNWLQTVSKTLCLKPQDVGSNPTTRKILSSVLAL